MSFRVELAVFSGPMDLLLHLVKQQEVSIHEVSIARILEDYLRHLRVLQALDLGDIGDFILMASTLMEIKSRELLPRDAVDVEAELDPRDDLIRRLLEYKRYRDLSRRLQRLSERRARMLPGGAVVPPDVVAANAEAASRAAQEDLLDLDEVDIWTLTAAFAKLLEETGQNRVMHLGVDKKDVAYYTRRLLDKVKRRKEMPFEELFDPAEGRYGLIGVFTAMLEMMKQGYLRAWQDRCFGPIVVAFKGPQDLTPEQVMSGGATTVIAESDDGG